jgi:long-subunit fatty acid transport protein
MSPVITSFGTVGWEDWSAFKNINISTGQGSQKIPRNWDDTWKFAAFKSIFIELVDS